MEASLSAESTLMHQSRISGFYLLCSKPTLLMHTELTWTSIQFWKIIFSWKILLNAQWKSEETEVLKTTSLSIEKHKYLFMNMPRFTQQPVTPTKWWILVLSPGIGAFVTQQTDRQAGHLTQLCQVCRRGYETLKFIKGRGISWSNRAFHSDPFLFSVQNGKLEL